MSRKRDEPRILTTKEERKQWGRFGKPDKVKEIEKVVRKHLLTGSIQVENLAREIYFL